MAESFLSPEDRISQAFNAGWQHGSVMAHDDTQLQKTVAAQNFREKLAQERYAMQLRNQLAIHAFTLTEHAKEVAAMNTQHFRNFINQKTITDATKSIEDNISSLNKWLTPEGSKNITNAKDIRKSVANLEKAKANLYRLRPDEQGFLDPQAAFAIAQPASIAAPIYTPEYRAKIEADNKLPALRIKQAEVGIENTQSIIEERKSKPPKADPELASAQKDFDNLWGVVNQATAASKIPYVKDHNGNPVPGVLDKDALKRYHDAAFNYEYAAPGIVRRLQDPAFLTKVTNDPAKAQVISEMVKSSIGKYNNLRHYSDFIDWHNKEVGKGSWDDIDEAHRYIYSSSMNILSDLLMKPHTLAPGVATDNEAEVAPPSPAEQVNMPIDDTQEQGGAQ